MTGDIQSLSLRALAEHIRDREISAREALESHLARIDEVNPVVNAIVTFDIDGATERASAADRATVSGEALPVLHGVPMTHKDNHLTAGLRTTFGSPILADNIPTEDSGIIDRLKRAGVNTTGKSNVPEFAAGSHTFNPLFGTTTNPYDPTRSAGGSSGGAAAAIAAGIQPAGDGSDMGGSLRTPGSFCNLVGYRPSLGRIPMLPAKNPWAWIARQGVLAHDIEDVRFLMRALAGPDSSSPRGLPLDDSYRSEEAGSLRGLKVAWTTDFGLGVPVDREVIDVLSRQLHVFEQLGASVDVDCPDLSDADEVFQTTRAFDFATAYGHLLDEHRHRMKSAVQWNVDKGMALTTRDMISQHRSQESRCRSAAVLLAIRRVDRACRSGTSVPRGRGVPRRRRRHADEQLPRLDAGRFADLGDRPTVTVDARRLQLLRSSGWIADRHRRPRRSPAAPGRACLRGRDGIPPSCARIGGRHRLTDPAGRVQDLATAATIRSVNSPIASAGVSDPDTAPWDNASAAPKTAVRDGVDMPSASVNGRRISRHRSK